ncbi:hypothetical protein [Psychroflexus sp. MES1-P1E]|uniref:hypothetical protein n=1 Tax=Psychroflexus sp. MES1-P1E TaxID=2058320 RepID=UPI000CAA8263|nr:hypothetical protein [Psychroflexus sp. MES1-P1E]PKG41596.1 hypothetical protein CXF67_14770 [Psychroflexus sp. MES1-P1E]
MKNVIKVVVLLSFLSCKAQVSSKAMPFENLITGTWVLENENNIKIEFNTNQIKKNIVNSQIIEEYDYSIENDVTDSGLKIYYLITQNTNDPNEEYHYEIDTLTDERLILVYQLPNGGVGERLIYIRL